MGNEQGTCCPELCETVRLLCIPADNTVKCVFFFSGVLFSQFFACVTLCHFQDFAMAGIKIGTLYTENRDLLEALAKLGPFHGIPGTTQHQVAQLLQDRGMDPSVTWAFATMMCWENNPPIKPLLVKISQMYSSAFCSSCTMQVICQLSGNVKKKCFFCEGFMHSREECFCCTLY